jgi:hypothetical protein
MVHFGENHWPSLDENGWPNLMRIYSNIANRYDKGMYVLLYIGGILYVVWQILEMAIRTKTS